MYIHIAHNVKKTVQRAIVRTQTVAMYTLKCHALLRCLVITATTHVRLLTKCWLGLGLSEAA